MFYFSSQTIHNVGDQRLLLGEEGEKMRWFLLPSEAAQLLSGKQVSHFPMTPPFTPLQWKNGSPVSEGTKSTGAEYMEPSDRTSTSSAQKGSSFLSELKATTSQGDMKPENEVDDKMTDSGGVVNGQIGNENFENSICDDEKCGECEGRDLCASQGMTRHKKPLLNDVTKSTAAANGQLSAVSVRTENMELKLDSEPRTENGHDGKHFAETGACGFSGSEKEEKTSCNDDNADCSFPVDNGAPTRESKTFGPASNQGTSWEEVAVITDSDSLTQADPMIVCQKKPRKNTENEVIPGKPQFHHPPKRIFKPATQVREPLIEMLILRSTLGIFWLIMPVKAVIVYLSVNISNTCVSSDFQAPRSAPKKRGATYFFFKTKLELLGNQIKHSFECLM